MARLTLLILLGWLGVAQAQDVLNNDSVIKLAKAGMSESVILTMVGQQAGNYSLRVEDLIALKQAGVSDATVAAMVAKGSGNAVSVSAGSALRLQNRTPVNLTLKQELSSGRTKSGDKFELTVADDVKVDGRVGIPKGTVAFGKVVSAQKKGFSGPNGLLELEIESLTVGGQIVPLRGSFKQGGERVGFPKRGKDIELPIGFAMEARIDGEVNVNPALPK